MTSAFLKSCCQGHSRSPEVKNRENKGQFHFFSKVGRSTEKFARTPGMTAITLLGPKFVRCYLLVFIYI